jgi:hypothetical protein
MDNTNSDNKTWISLAMAAALVEAGIFESVEFGFLPVGHTHEDIDQSFSVIGQWLQKDNADTMDDLRDACVNAFIDLDSARRKNSGAHERIKTVAFLLERGDIISWATWLNRKEWLKDKQYSGIREIYA